MLHHSIGVSWAVGQHLCWKHQRNCLQSFQRRCPWGYGWYSLGWLSASIETNAHLHNWCNGFRHYALETLELLISENKEHLDSKESIAEQMAAFLESAPVSPNSDLNFHAFHCRHWSIEATEREGFGLNLLVLQTFALAHLAYLDGVDDFTEEKPIGVLILSMQAVRIGLFVFVFGY